MSIVVRTRRTLAVATTVLAVTAGLTVAPLAVSAASAASSSSSAASVLSSVNKLRVSKGVDKLLPNGFIKAWAAEYAAGMAKHKSIYANVTPKTQLPSGYDTDTTPPNGLRVKVPSGTTSSVYAYIKKYFASTMTDGDYNYGAVGWAKSGSTVYADIILFHYDAAPLDLLTEGTPAIKGTAKVGGTLTASVSTNATGATRSYQWKVAGVNVGTDQSTYVPVAADLGHKVTVTITVTKDGFVTPSAKSSASTKSVAHGTLTRHTPVVTGNRNVGQTLTATVSPWGPGTVTLGYQWLRNGKAISGATSATYLQADADLGKKIDVKVTGTEAGFTSSSLITATKTTTKAALAVQ